MAAVSPHDPLLATNASSPPSMPQAQRPQQHDHQQQQPKQQLPAHQRFLKGVAISVWQNAPDSCAASQWTSFARKPHTLGQRLGAALRGGNGRGPQMRIDDGSPDFWNRYHEDIAAAKALGCNSLRLSLEWARVMPSGPGRVDEAAVDRYHAIFDACRAAGVEPMLTLHHFTHPDWFQKLGGFEKEANIRYFEDWAATAYRLFQRHRIALWGTFNEPTCAAFTGYIVGIHAPGRRGAVAAAGAVLLHMLRAHTAAYHALKREGGEDVRVGLVHQHIRFEPEGTGGLYGAAKWTADWLTHCFGWDVVHAYMLSGTFEWRLLGPGRGGSGGMLRAQEAAGRPPCDWLGINYYTRVVLSWRLAFTARPGEVLTDMGWPVVPQGLGQAIAHSAELGIPLYVTETGLADGADDRRAGLIAAYWDQVSQAVASGADVRGFYYWTLVDNFEWHLGYNMKFGLYEWTHAPPGAQPHPAAGPHNRKTADTMRRSQGSHHHSHHHSHNPFNIAHHPHGSHPPHHTHAHSHAHADRHSSPTRRKSVSLARLRSGPNPAATATATIIGVSPPATPTLSGLPALTTSASAAPSPSPAAFSLTTAPATAAAPAEVASPGWHLVGRPATAFGAASQDVEEEEEQYSDRAPLLAANARAVLESSYAASDSGAGVVATGVCAVSPRPVGEGDSVGLSGEAEAVLAAAEEHVHSCPLYGRRLRRGALELVRRYVSLPDDLDAAHRVLRTARWPAVPLLQLSEHGGWAGGSRGRELQGQGVAGLLAGVLRSAGKWALGVPLVVAAVVAVVAVVGPMIRGRGNRV